MQALLLTALFLPPDPRPPRCGQRCPSSRPQPWMRPPPPRPVQGTRKALPSQARLSVRGPRLPATARAVPSAWRSFPLPRAPLPAKPSSLRIKMRAMFQGTFWAANLLPRCWPPGPSHTIPIIWAEAVYGPPFPSAVSSKGPGLGHLHLPPLHQPGAHHEPGFWMSDHWLNDFLGAVTLSAKWSQRLRVLWVLQKSHEIKRNGRVSPGGSW